MKMRLILACLVLTSADLVLARKSLVKREVATTTLTPVTAPPCSGPSKSPATYCNQYYECLQEWWWWAPTLETCPDGEVFDETISDCSTVGSGRCAQNSATTSTVGPAALTTVTVPPVTTTTGRISTSTVAVTVPPITTTTDGRVSTSTVVVPTTTAAPPVTPPTCTAAGNYPAPLCNQYYQCVYVMWWWDYQLQTCASGQGFDVGTGQCAVVANC